MSGKPAEATFHCRDSDTAELRLAGSFTFAANRVALDLDIAIHTGLHALHAIDAGIVEWDSALLALILRVKGQCDQAGITFDLSGLPRGVRRLVELSATVPEREGSRSRASASSFLVRLGRRVTAAHEFFHAIQYSYYSEGLSWWMEATATWMEDVAYDEVNDYYQYLDMFFNGPTDKLDRFTGAYDVYANGACVFVHYLVERPSGSPDVIRQIWERVKTRQSGALSLFDQVIPGGLRKAMEEFARWNYFTGSRARPEFYRDGAGFPEVATRTIQLDAAAKVVGSGSVDRLACDYLRIRPGGMQGGVRLYLEGGGDAAWAMQVLLLRPDAYDVQSLSDTLAVPMWDRYDEIVLIPTATSWTGTGDSYSYSVRFDPSLTDSLVVFASRLMPPRPHPFRPHLGAQVYFPFELARYTERASLSIFTEKGELVRRIEHGSLPAHEHAEIFAWDGMNERGYTVGSGLYFYRIDADGFSGTGKVAVMR